MNVIYKIPGYILCLLGGFFLSWGGLIVRLFENADIWQMLFLRSLFFLIALTFFLLITYKSETFQIIKKSKNNGGLVLSLSFVSYLYQ